MKLTLNPLLIPGIIILKVRGKVLKATSLGEPIPDIVDEIAMCLSDYEDLRDAALDISGIKPHM
jgi:hypothetical protein